MSTEKNMQLAYKTPKHNPKKNKSRKFWGTARCKKGNKNNVHINIVNSIERMLSIELRKNNECWCISSNENEMTNKCYPSKHGCVYIKNSLEPCVCVNVNVQYTIPNEYIKTNMEQCLDTKKHDIKYRSNGCKLIEIARQCILCNSITGVSLCGLWSNIISNCCYDCNNKYLKSINIPEMPEWLNLYIPHYYKNIKNINSKLINGMSPQLYVRSTNVQIWYYSCLFVLDLLNLIFVDDLIKIICDYTSFDIPYFCENIAICTNIQRVCVKSCDDVPNKNKKKDKPNIEQIERIFKLFVRIN